MTASYNLELLYLHLQPNYNQFNYSTMAKITKEAALLYHSQGKPGKIEVVPTKPYSTQTDLSLAYSPGVAEPCLEIEKNPQDAYKYTAKGNLVAVISNGTAVLGLGDIGALSGKPVMEGKGLLFKIYAGIDVFDIEVNEKDPDKFIIECYHWNYQHGFCIVAYKLIVFFMSAPFKCFSAVDIMYIYKFPCICRISTCIRYII